MRQSDPDIGEKKAGALSVLVTGADGFIGRHVVRALAQAGHQVIAGVRSGQADRSVRTYGDLAHFHDWGSLVDGLDVVVHLAARAHKNTGAHEEALFRSANVAPTLALAEALALSGGKRLVFVSSIGVHGDKTVNQAFAEDDKPNPVEAYSRSKLEAEEGLRQTSHRTGLELVIIRPTLVYGPDAPGNFGALARLARSGLPLPVAGIRNRRSFVGVENLASLLALCVSHPAGRGECFIAADGEDISTADLFAKLAAAAGASDRSFSFPVSLLRLMARVVGKAGLIDKLACDLQVDGSKAQRLLGWQPPVTLDEGLARAMTGARRDAR